MTPERLRALRRGAAFSGFALLAFSVALVLSFPYERAKDRVIDLFAQQNLDATIESAGPTLGFGLSLKEIAVRTRPLAPAKPNRFFIDWAKVRVSPLAALFGGSRLEVEASAFGGHVSFKRKVTKTDLGIVLAVSDVDAGQMPGVRDAINLPLSGTFELSVDLTLPEGRLAESSGTIEWKCADCVLGDGKEKLKIASNPLLAEGLTVPRIRLGDLVGRIVVEKGVGRVQELTAKSPDGELHLEGEVTLRDPFSMSTLNAYLTFRVSDALVKSNDKIQLLLQLAEANGKRADGFYGVLLRGVLQSLDQPLWSKAGPVFTQPGTKSGKPSITPARSLGAPSIAPATPAARQAQITAAPDNPAPAAPSITQAQPLPAPPPPVAPPSDDVVRATPPPATTPTVMAPGPAILGEGLRHTLTATPPAAAPTEPPKAGDKPAAPAKEGEVEEE